MFCRPSLIHITSNLELNSPHFRYVDTIFNRLCLYTYIGVGCTLRLPCGPRDQRTIKHIYVRICNVALIFYDFFFPSSPLIIRFVSTTMADSASESDSSSIDGGPIMMPPSPITREQMQKRIDSLQQQNRVLKVELETYKLKMKAMDEECKRLRETSVYIVCIK